MDTIFGATSVQLAPEHPLVAAMTAKDVALKAQVDTLIDEQKRARESGDIGAIEKHGVPTGHFAINPYSGEHVPIWIANYILADYGTGAIMSVPAHDERDFEFATKYGIPIRRVIAPADPKAEEPALPFTTKDGVVINSGEFNGLSYEEAVRKFQDKAVAGGFGESKITFPPERLGSEPAALLGYAHSHDSLRARRHRSRARRSVARVAAGED